MILPDDARRAIEEHLFDFVEELASKKKTDYANVQIITPGSNKAVPRGAIAKGADTLVKFREVVLYHAWKRV